MSTNPYLSGSFAPIGQETPMVELRAEGEIPRDLAGRFVRNGPNPRQLSGRPHHWFDGDGMVHAVHIEDGRAFYQSRWIQTNAFRSETQAGQVNAPGLMDDVAFDGAHFPYKDTANTDIVFFAGAWWATWYLAGTPYRLEPDRLGPLEGTPVARMSAHCKVDRHTQELLFFDYGLERPFMQFGVLRPDGTLAHMTPVDLPGPRLPHDMAITENHAILMDFPLTLSQRAFEAGRWSVSFLKDTPSRYGIIRRDGSSIRWFEGRPGYIYHVINAWEEDDAIILHACCTSENYPRRMTGWGELDPMMTYLRLDARWTRLRFDLRTGQTTEERLDDRNVEFPTVHEGFQGRANHNGYIMKLADTDELRFEGICRANLHTGQLDEFSFGPNRWGSESPFAPRLGAVDENDGYLLSFVQDEGTGRSEVWVIDAQEWSPEPVAKIPIPVRVPLGFHSSWVPEEVLQGSRWPGAS